MKLRDLLCQADYFGHLYDASVSDGRLSVDIAYPRSEPAEVKEIQIGLLDVRAADSILISYDFDRDGYVIKQASRFSWAIDETPDPDWQEVAFIRAWQREETNTDD